MTLTHYLAAYLWRNPSLLALLGAQVVSSTGSLMTAIALPWFVLTTTGSPARMSLVVAVQLVPIVLFGIPLGKLAARLGPRRTMLVADFLWAPLVALIPILHYAGLLSFPLLLWLAFVIGIFRAPYDAAQTMVLPEIVGEDARLVAQANALFQTALRTTYLLGPALGGTLVASLGAPRVLFIDAATFLVSFALIAACVPILKRSPKAADLGDLLAGVRCLMRDRLLRFWSLAQVGSQTAFQALAIGLTVLAFTRYGQDAKVAGLLFAAWGGGALVGSILSYQAVSTWEPLVLGRIAWAGYALPLWALVAPLPPEVAAAFLVVSGLGNGLRNAPVMAVVTLRMPISLRSQTMTTFSSMATLGSLIALSATGPAAELFGLTAVFATVALVSTASAALFAWASVFVPAR